MVEKILKCLYMFWFYLIVCDIFYLVSHNSQRMASYFYVIPVFICLEWRVRL